MSDHITGTEKLMPEGNVGLLGSGDTTDGTNHDRDKSPRRGQRANLHKVIAPPPPEAPRPASGSANPEINASRMQTQLLESIKKQNDMFRKLMEAQQQTLVAITQIVSNAILAAALVVAAPVSPTLVVSTGPPLNAVEKKQRQKLPKQVVEEIGKEQGNIDHKLVKVLQTKERIKRMTKEQSDLGEMKDTGKVKFKQMKFVPDELKQKVDITLSSDDTTFNLHEDTSYIDAKRIIFYRSQQAQKLIDIAVANLQLKNLEESTTIDAFRFKCIVFKDNFLESLKESGSTMDAAFISDTNDDFNDLTQKLWTRSYIRAANRIMAEKKAESTALEKKNKLADDLAERDPKVLFQNAVRQVMAKKAGDKKVDNIGLFVDTQITDQQPPLDGQMQVEEDGKNMDKYINDPNAKLGGDSGKLPKGKGKSHEKGKPKGGKGAGRGSKGGGKSNTKGKGRGGGTTPTAKSTGKGKAKGKSKDKGKENKAGKTTFGKGKGNPAYAKAKAKGRTAR